MEPFERQISQHSEDTYDEQDWADVSIVMIQNLPCRCTPEEVAAAADELGFGDYVNYLHIPRKSRNGRNCGYGFIGFISPEVTLKFRDVFEGYTLRSRTSSKQLTLKPAHQQQATVRGLQHVKPVQKQGDDIIVERSPSGSFSEAAAMQEKIDLLASVLNKDLSDTASTVQKQMAHLPASVLNKDQNTLSQAYAQQMQIPLLSKFRPPPGLELKPALALITPIVIFSL